MLHRCLQHLKFINTEETREMYTDCVFLGFFSMLFLYKSSYRQTLYIELPFQDANKGQFHKQSNNLQSEPH